MTVQLRSHFTFRPRSSVYAVLDDLMAVRDFSQHLMELDFGDLQVQVLEGHDGIKELDVDGRHHGLVARMVRAMQGITDEREHIGQYVQALLKGCYVVAVAVPPRKPDAVRRIAGAFRSCGAHHMHHYGAWVVEALGA